MKISLQPIPSVEIVHYCSSELMVVSHANRVHVDYAGERRTCLLPQLGWKRICLPFRLARRAFRVDKCNVTPVFDNGVLESLVIIRQGCIYHWEYATSVLTMVRNLRHCQNVLHQSICTTPAGNLFFGEYGNNGGRAAVPVYGSYDHGRSWQIVHEFPGNTVKHLHGCYWDPYEERIWICSGDFEGENFLIRTDEKFSEIGTFGDGSQSWRTCCPFFLPEHIVWGMDSQLETSYLCVFDRKTHQLCRTQVFPGPVWYGKRLEDGGYLLATANEIGPGVYDDSAHIFFSPDAFQWEEVFRVRHDRWPKRYFKFGVLAFADGPQTRDNFAMFAEALSGMDGRAYQCSLIS